MYRFCFNKNASLAKVEALFEDYVHQLVPRRCIIQGNMVQYAITIVHGANDCGPLVTDELVSTEPEQSCPTPTVSSIGYCILGLVPIDSHCRLDMTLMSGYVWMSKF